MFHSVLSSFCLHACMLGGLGINSEGRMFLIALRWRSSAAEGGLVLREK